MTDVITTELQKRKLYAASLVIHPEVAILVGKDWKEFLRQMHINISLKLVELELWDQYTASVLHDLLNPPLTFSNNES